MRELVFTVILGIGCGGPTAAVVDAGADAVITGDASGPQRSLHVCWNDASCPRALAVAHGGAWDVMTAPYDSNAALVAAYVDGDDGVKLDVRVTLDAVPVIAHSSPIEVYESVECSGMKIEEMTAAEVTACHRFPSSTETFQRLDDVLGYLRDRMVVQLDVKLATDIAQTCAAIHAAGAEDYAFLEITSGDLSGALALADSTSIFELVNVASDLGAIAPVLALHDPRVFMLEIDLGVALGTAVTDQLHPADVRAFVYDDTATPTSNALVAHYHDGFDVVSSQSGPVGVMARQQVNTERGLTPP